jgi:uncharacterized OB-fold protein
MSNALAFPYPVPEFGTEQYWDAANRRELRVQRCLDCGRLRWEPAPLCLDCQSQRHEWAPLSGHGTVYSFTEITHPVHPAAFAKVPYIVVEVELAEQPNLRMISNLVDTPASAVKIGAAVTVDFIAHPNGQHLPVFRLRS